MRRESPLSKEVPTSCVCRGLKLALVSHAKREEMLARSATKFVLTKEIASALTETHPVVHIKVKHGFKATIAHVFNLAGDADIAADGFGFR